MESRLKGAGYKLTRQRRAVLDVVSAAPTGLSATQLLEEARRQCPRVGLATVYRTLEILDQVGGVERVHLPGQNPGYVSCPPTAHHHVVCLSCGRVADFQGCIVGEMESSVMAQTGFTIEQHLLELLGTCPACRQQRGSRTTPCQAANEALS